MLTGRCLTVVPTGKEPHTNDYPLDRCLICLTSIAGPGICLLTVITERSCPSAVTQCGLKQSVSLKGQSQHALDNVQYHSTVKLYSQVIGAWLSSHFLLQGWDDDP